MAIEFHTKYLSPAYSTWMADRMDSHGKIMFMTWRSCQVHITHKVCCSLLCCSQQSLKPAPVILLRWWYMILSINKWVFPFLYHHSIHLFPPRFSTPTGILPIQWLTIATDMKSQEEVVTTLWQQEITSIWCYQSELYSHQFIIPLVICSP